MNLDLKFYWGLFLKRLPVMLALFLVCAISATVSALKLPPTYSTSALLLVEEARIPNSMLGQVAQSDAARQLQVIQQRLLTRANLLDIARKHEVFEDMRSMLPDEIVRRMSSQTNIRRTGGRDQANLMQISFEARYGEIAANVVNEYVTLILQESVDFRMARTEGALAFFEQEVERLNEDLSLQSAEIVRFRNENANALPGDIAYRQNRQSLLQERQARLEREIAGLEKQRKDMIAIFEATGEVDTGDGRSPEEKQLADLRYELAQALTVYSENNPRITMLRNRIENLQTAIESGAIARITRGAEADTPATLLDVTLADIAQRKENLEEELAGVNKQLETLETSIQATAGNAITLSALQRDFNNIQTRYDQAVRNLDQARVNERIEVTSQGQRITVIENANVPQKPSGPKRTRMIAMGIIAGAGLAAGFFVLLELLNRAIRRPAELESKFGIIPIAVVPYMESRRERLLRRGALLAAFIAVLIGVPATLWYIDTQYMPLDILANKVFDRLGLT